MFFRRPDHQRGYALVARDDGVIYRLDGGPVTAALPHDLVHLVVEDTLGIADGIWGAIAGGVVFRSMAHQSGRRPPHAAERSAALIREHRQNLQRAEHLGGLVERVAHGQLRAEDAGRQLGVEVDVDAVRTAAQALHDAEARWRALPIGGQLSCHWPAHRRVGAPMIRRRTNSQSRRSRATASSSTSSRLQNANRTSRRPASWSS
jgi:hypothetical protein